MVCDQQCQHFGKKTKLVYPECKTALYGMLHRIFNELGRKLLVFIIPHINQMLVSLACQHDFTHMRHRADRSVAVGLGRLLPLSRICFSADP